MFKLESNRLKREFKISDGKFYASQILNTYSGMSFIPDGNGCEFVIHFVDGQEYSSKGLMVVDSGEENNHLWFTFQENMGVSVTLEYWVHRDGNTICKQVLLSQSDDREIDFVELECIGIINSKTHFSVDVVEGGEIPALESSLGQPFYIDSLFFGCEFPATENRIIHGTGSIRYYIGRNVGKSFACPVTVMGGALDNTIVEVKKAFFEYIDFISVGASLRFQFNSWYDHMRDIDEQKVLHSFAEVHDQLEKYGAPALDAYVVDDGWPDMKASFWSFNKKFPEGMTNIAKQCKDFGSSFGMWVSPRGGYFKEYKLGKRFQKGGNGYLNKDEMSICVASSDYVSKLKDFLIEKTKEYDMSYWKLDGFVRVPCKNADHDHMVGGENDMYFITDKWEKWIDLYKALREVKPDIWVNMTCYVNVSPWWLQWVNSLWVQNSSDIDFCDNVDHQPQVEAEITYRDGRYYDCLCKRANQIPLKHLYNHEPIYGNRAKVSYTDDEFEKYINWCMVRGQAINELHLSPSMMSEAKWQALAKAMNCQKANYHILQNAEFIGGDPTDNNIYGYIGWTKDGEGIIALRNPNYEKTSLTLTFNSLMGAPLCLEGAKRYNIYCKTLQETDEIYNYNSKMDLTMNPFEVMIFKIGKNR